MKPRCLDEESSRLHSRMNRVDEALAHLEAGDA
jgi:hypothetical protein